jgi:dihydroorotase-like cyclic amidohydrolase
VTAETAPHYFSLTDESWPPSHTDAKVTAPTHAEDIRAIKEGLKDGTIDAIASEAAPHASTDKEMNSSTPQTASPAGNLAGTDLSSWRSISLSAN